MAKNVLITRPPETKNGFHNEGYFYFNSPKQGSLSFPKSYTKTIESFNSVQKATAASTDINTRSPYYSADFYRQRPFDILPARFRDVVFSCRMAYMKFGVVRNVIDLMTDFASEGLRFIHPDVKIDAFFKVWMKKVKLNDAVDEFIRHLLVDGNVVIKRTTAKLTDPVKRQWEEKSLAGSPPEKLYTQNQPNKNEIPWRFSFLNVAALYWIGGEANIANSSRSLAFRPAETLIQAIRTPRDIFQQQLVNNLPEDVRKAVKENNSNIILLDMDDIYVAHNKKDTWEDWAPPFLYSILSDLQYKEKLRQAENSAMDGWMNVIRLWKLGDHTNKIFPPDVAFSRLTDILEANTGGGAVDIIWDSMIDMQEYYPPVDKILGPEKYQQVNKDILIGLGVPEVLIGGDGAKFSNSWIQLKTLVERLEYVREKVIEWLAIEVKMVCDAMGFDLAPAIKFNNTNLEDQSAYRKLLVGLLDRNIISVEAVLQAYGQDEVIELERIKSEKKKLKDAKVDVIGPYDPQQPEVRSGSQPAKPGVPGRPTGDNSVAPNTRTPKPKQGQPSSKASELTVFALDAIKAIDEYAIPIYMEELNVANARKLTTEQKEEINNIRIMLLASINPDQSLDEESIISSSAKINEYNPHIIQIINNNLLDFAASKGQAPTLGQRKNIEAISWAQYYITEGEFNA